MELYSFDGVDGVTDPHDFSVVEGFGGYFEAWREGVSLSDEGVVACGREGVVDAFEQAFPIVLYPAGFSMHQSRCGYDSSAEGVDDSLVP